MRPDDARWRRRPRPSGVAVVTARIGLRRAYEAPGADEGTRILVDRLWPRGLTKARAKLDLWLKEIAPTDELRHWFGHEPARWDEFQPRYRAELDANPSPLDEMIDRCRAGPVTLLFAAHDAGRNNAVVVRDVLRERLKA
jgi:uncharacterized protein YeaO (DUF488 family)